MTRRLRWTLLALAALLLAGLVGRAWLARKADRARAAQAVPAVLAVELAPGDVVAATLVELTQAVEVSGGLKAVRSAVVKARVAAEVREVAVREGDTVQAGQLVARLDDTEYRFRLRQAEQQAASARAQMQLAQRTLDNNRALVEQGFISKNALDTSAFNSAAAEAGLQAAEAAADLARKAQRDTEVRAPIAGVVAQRAVQVGERVSVDARLLEIVDLSRIELEAAVTPEDLGSVTVGAAARLHVDGVEAPVTARVARINPSTQTGTRAVVVYLALDPAPGLRQGLFARGEIETGRRRALAVPRSAVRVDQARPYALAVAGGRAQRRPVTTGATGSASFGGLPAEPATEIASGLAAGELVLRGRIGTLRDGTPVRLAAGTPAAAPPPAAVPPGAASGAPPAVPAASAP